MSQMPHAGLEVCPDDVTGYGHLCRLAVFAKSATFVAIGENGGSLVKVVSSEVDEFMITIHQNS
ncbi:MAG: hypothetical protein OXU19_09565 [bacterium]|nr:hypothetical protein [bacterium]MDE0418446.1 hypothetical protein [bacterium]